MSDHFCGLPVQFLEKLHNQWDQPTCNSIIQSFHTRKPLSVRINTLKLTTENARAALSDQGIVTKQVPWYENALILPYANSTDITNLDLYKNGSLYIQQLSSMIPVIVLDPLPGEMVLDIAAAPGSKTTQVASHMGNTGHIIANDISRQRIFKLRTVLQQMGVTNTEISIYPGQTLWHEYPEKFDRVLVDASCSMEARFMCDDPSSSKTWTPKKVKQLSSQQKYLLRSAIAATKPGGVIVYSTCTLSREENEEVIEWILRKEGDAIQLSDISIPHFMFTNGIVMRIPEITKTKRIIPSGIMEGFFIAKIIKKTSTIPAHLRTTT